MLLDEFGKLDIDCSGDIFEEGGDETNRPVVFDFDWDWDFRKWEDLD